MLFRVNPNDVIPIYRQLVRQVRAAVASGNLKPGDKLPSQRKLALELVINHLTVKKAYETLEAEGLIHTDRGRGTFVSDIPDRSNLKREGVGNLKQRLRESAATARLLGLDKERFLTLAGKAWKKGNRK
ncbi:MAG: GntR family transcriptional regulator [Deltaproteobacteria bacterium]|nr:GntR family transcriptional regulator [Deltaproteobacteria bacterium]